MSSQLDFESIMWNDTAFPTSATFTPDPGTEDVLSGFAEMLKIGADAGYVDAQVNYGIWLLIGIGMSRNEEEAVRYFKMAADAGDV